MQSPSNLAWLLGVVFFPLERNSYFHSKSTISTVLEETTIAEVKRGNQAAFKTLYEQCIGYVYTIVRRYVSNESDHKDVIQEVFARVFLSAKSFDPHKGEFKFWLRRLTINQCFKNSRQGKSPMYAEPLDAAKEIETNETEASLLALSRTEIETMLQEMPKGYRTIFLLIAMDDYTHKEAAELLNISTEASRSQFSRAKAWLRNNINNQKKISFDYETTI